MSNNELGYTILCYVPENSGSYLWHQLFRCVSVSYEKANHVITIHIVIIYTMFVFCNNEYNCCRKARVVITIFDYSPMWETMQKMGVSQYQLLKGGIDNKTLDSLKKGKNITLVTMEKLCKIIDCTPNDIVKFK